MTTETDMGPVTIMVDIETVNRHLADAGNPITITAETVERAGMVPLKRTRKPRGGTIAPVADEVGFRRPSKSKTKPVAHECRHCHVKTVSAVKHVRGSAEAGTDIYFCKNVRECNARVSS